MSPPFDMKKAKALVEQLHAGEIFDAAKDVDVVFVERRL
jgi:hypothetical protein